MKTRIALSKPFFDADEIKELRGVLDSGWVVKGPKVKEFEDAVCKYLGVRHAIAVTNCTSALHLALLGVGVSPGDEVLVADYTYPATGHAVLHCAARPVFVDIDKRTYNIDPGLIEKKITKKTKAIIPVHTFGQPARMDEITALAGRRGLKVVEDAACALGAKYKNAPAGTFGDAGCFSLHGRKGVTTGEGGIVVTDNSRLAEKVRAMSAFGMQRPVAGKRRKAGGFCVSEFTEPGYNYKMSDITAAIGIAQLRKLDRIVSGRRALARYWDSRLKGIDLISAPYVDSKAAHIYQSYVALLDRRVDRDGIISALIGEGIQANIGTYSSCMQPVYRSKDRCPDSKEVFNRAIALPMHYQLKKKDIDLTVRVIKDALKEGS
ncbi:DegT/DnrJ/EryC1/StrS family aminotransferase [Candidatus Omnitrophota bacterium]